MTPTKGIGKRRIYNMKKENILYPEFAKYFLEELHKKIMREYTKDIYKYIDELKSQGILPDNYYLGKDGCDELDEFVLVYIGEKFEEEYKKSHTKLDDELEKENK